MNSLKLLTVLLLSTSSAFGAIHDSNLFTDYTLPANDDGSTGNINIGFNINFFGGLYSSLYVNNNGNVTFSSPMSTYTPFNIVTTGISMLAPFFADVDTRGAGSGLVQYGQDTLNGHQVFGVNWFDVGNGVGYYSSHADKTNSFQLIITDRSDIQSGDFDFQFNYDRIQWETGDASGGINGFGGSSARAGWSNGSTNSYELSGSALVGGFLDSNLTTGLIHNSLNSSISGQYNFQVRNGDILPPPVPEPEEWAMMLLGVPLIGWMARRKEVAA